MMRQAASMGMRLALRTPGHRVAGQRLAPNNSVSLVSNCRAGFASSSGGGPKGGANHEQLQVPSNIEKSDSAQQAVFHLEKGPQQQPSYQPGASGSGSSAYDQRLSLHSVMQSNVPQPFSAPGKAPSHLNMPGAPEKQTDKYVAQQVQQLHTKSNQ